MVGIGVFESFSLRGILFSIIILCACVFKYYVYLQSMCIDRSCLFLQDLDVSELWFMAVYCLFLGFVSVDISLLSLVLLALNGIF